MSYICLWLSHLAKGSSNKQTLVNWSCFLILPLLVSLYDLFIRRSSFIPVVQLQMLIVIELVNVYYFCHDIGKCLLLMLPRLFLVFLTPLNLFSFIVYVLH